MVRSSAGMQRKEMPLAVGSRCKFGNLFSQIFTTEAVGSHNYQRTYSLLFDWQGELLLPLTDILFDIYLLIADYVRR